MELRLDGAGPGDRPGRPVWHHLAPRPLAFPRAVRDLYDGPRHRGIRLSRLLSHSVNPALRASRECLGGPDRLADNTYWK